MAKKIIFRADGNGTTGLGHLYRLFALVEMFKNDFDYIFVTTELSLLAVIPKEYNVYVIPKEISFNDEPIWLSEKYPSNSYLLIADGYQFGSCYQKKIKNLGYKMVYIDDLETYHMYADLVINHSPHAQIEHYKRENYTKFALGLDFAILRPMFLNVLNRTKTVEHLNVAFVCFGGADKDNYTYKITQELLCIDSVDRINIVVGGAYQFSEIFELQKKNSKIKVFKNLDEEKLYDLMNSCTFAIVPTSTILFELIAVNMYLFSGFYVENQRKAYYELEKRKVFTGIGDFNNYKFTFLSKKLLSLSSFDIKKQLDLQKELIDGNQKNRFLAKINELN